MKKGYRSLLPESAEEFKELVGKDAFRFNVCVKCGHKFSGLNTHSSAGWQETQISGYCEDCFDKLFQESDHD